MPSPPEFDILPNGTVTSPKGFLAGATFAGLKTYGAEKLDMGILYSEAPCTAAGVFTTNQVKAASVLVCAKHLKLGRAQAIIANSGCANACVGAQGMKDALETTELAARKLGLEPEQVLIASTGIIGVELPMALIRRGINQVSVSPDRGAELAKAIMTTDTHPKEVAVRLELDGRQVTIGGIAKGAGMIHPNMATMLSFIATDAAVERAFLQQALRDAVDSSFNMITVDGDTSTNDTVLLLANGASGGRTLESQSPEAALFADALKQVCMHLAKQIVRDGEGSTRLIEVTVEGARNVADARSAARTIASSSLVKTAVHGGDPNWGRILGALGRSGAKITESKVALWINGICTMEKGTPVPFYKDAAVASMKAPEVSIRVALNLGRASATAWGCDLSQEYVRLNSVYTT